MMLYNLPTSGRPSNLEKSRASAYCAYSRCGWGCLDYFSLIYHYSPLSPSFWETARYRLKYCMTGPLNPKQTTNQLASYSQFPGERKKICSLTALSILLKITIFLGCSQTEIIPQKRVALERYCVGKRVVLRH